ncbi:MAG TPA: DUF1700 domain-containing protein [Caulobacteraceae bacterium]
MNASPATLDPRADYLRRLEWALRPLPGPDRGAIVAEISSHLAERFAGPGATTAAIVATLGEPDDLARAYVEDSELSGALHRAAPGHLLATILSRATRSITAFVVGLGAVILYVLGLSFVAVAVLKPIAPRNVGLWLGPHTFDFGILGSPPGVTREALGLWILPLSAACAVLCYLAAGVLMKRGARALLRRPSRRPAA